tara:strand:- start:415 stop:909 length:495 start_codon:yes stop_codon:yes gene_type:complete
MPRVKAGEMSLNEIRNIARQHNKVSTIKGIDTLSRAKLIEEIGRMGYNVDHENKKIIKNKMNRSVNKQISVSAEGERKPQKRTKKKALIAGGEAPPMVKKTTKKGNARKGKPVGSRLAFDATKQEANKNKKAKPPPIKPALEKQRKKKEELAQKKKALVGSYGA